jgi:hypothetical protein
MCVFYLKHWLFFYFTPVTTPTEAPDLRSPSPAPHPPGGRGTVYAAESPPHTTPASPLSHNGPKTRATATRTTTEAPPAEIARVERLMCMGLPGKAINAIASDKTILSGADDAAIEAAIKLHPQGTTGWSAPPASRSLVTLKSNKI